MNTREKVTLHFDLSHCSQDAKFNLLAGNGKTYSLRAYKDVPEKMEIHRAQNKALGLIPENQLQRFTHFVDDVELHATGVSMRRIVFDSLDDHPLPEIALVFQYVGTKHVRQYIRQHSASNGNTMYPAVLAHYGIRQDAVSPADLDEIRLHAHNLVGPLSTAQALVCHHPEIGSVNPDIALHVLEYLDPRKSISFNNLVNFIRENGAGTDNQWYNKSWVMWSKNPEGSLDQGMEPVTPDLDLIFKDGKKASWPINPDTGQPGLPTYTLTDEFDPPAKTGDKTKTLSAYATACVHETLRKTKNDPQLNGQLWNTQQGKTQKVQTEVKPSVQTRTNLVASGAAKGFAIKNITSSYGLWLYDQQMAWDDAQKTLTIPMKNWPNRYLSAFVEFFDSTGQPIERKDIDGWKDPIPDFLQKAFEGNVSKNYLTWLSAGSTVFGAPVPFLTQQTNLNFLWPQKATKADILLGGLGVAQGFQDWDGDVDLIGVLGTGLMCYGVSSITMVLQVKVINPFIAGLKGDAAIAFYIIAGYFGAVATVIGGLEYKTSAGKFILSKMAGMAAGVIFGQITKRAIPALAKMFLKKFFELSAEFMAEMTAEEAVEAVPVAGWALKIAAVASNVADMTATTIECLASPATYKLEILHTMDLTVTVEPDKTHGKEGVNPVWPAIGDHYVIRVQYPKGKDQEGGTTFTKSGPMPGKKDDPIVVTFDGIPAGGKIDVIAGIYSENDWLAGQWDSGWVDSAPDENGRQAVGGSIKENLVPLTATTVYNELQTLAYDTKRQHYWQASKFSILGDLIKDLNRGGAPDAAVQAAFSNNGVTLSNNTAITVTTPGNDWTLRDKGTGTEYHIFLKQIPNTDPQQNELEVQNLTRSGPPLPAHWPLSSGSGSNSVAALQNITYNTKQYMLGYAWQASGQNLPRDYGSAPDTNQMYAMQSISTLSEPQVQIIQPTRGFTNPSFIAFDQFGLTPLFSLNIADVAKLQNGPVAADIVEEFKGFGFELPSTAEVTVLKNSTKWQIAVPSSDPLYELRVVVNDNSDDNSATNQAIGVYAWPLPVMDNFYLDSRTYTRDKPLYYLRGIPLDMPPGEYSFDYDSSQVWGAFNDITIQGMAVHPHGYVVAVDYQNHKLLTLKLPAQACDVDEAPFAMPLSGEGLREGLLLNPQALTITADGRILILEQGNQRIQAFDIRGNPVPCFSVNQPSFTISQDYISTLDGLSATTAFVQEFQKNTAPALAPLIPPLLGKNGPVIINDLNNGSIDEAFLEDLQDYGLADTKYTIADFSVTQTTSSQLWLVTDKKTQAVYDIRAVANNSDAGIAIYRVCTLAIVQRSAGQEWEVSDTTNAITYEVTKPVTGTALTVQRLSAVMPLREEDKTSITYLDLAVENKGYIYVLSVKENAGQPVFRLDIHEPNGKVLLANQQIGINANKLAVDQWRSMFTLNFNTILGPGQRTEPGISQWEPSTPAGATPTE